VHGLAEVVTGESAAITDVIRGITRRYLPETEVDSYVATWSELRTVVTVKPERIVSWSTGG
jgi:hypothetical protein